MEVVWGADSQTDRKKNNKQTKKQIKKKKKKKKQSQNKIKNLTPKLGTPKCFSLHTILTLKFSASLTEQTTSITTEVATGKDISSVNKCVRLVCG